MKAKRIVRLVSIFLIISFGGEQLCQSAPLATGTHPSIQTSLQDQSRTSLATIIKDPARINIPFDYVDVKELHDAGADRLIIHIQDAHANIGGQRSLADAVDFFINQYGINQIFVEGGSGDVSLSEVRKTGSIQDWKIISNQLLNDGLITGEEYLNLTTDSPMNLIGVENRQLYDSGLETYFKLAQTRKSGLEYLRQWTRSIDYLKNKLYPDDLLAYERNKATQNDTSDFNSNIDRLQRLSKTSGVDISLKYSAIAQLQSMKAIEDQINFEELNKEQSALLNQLERSGNLRAAGDLKESLKKYDSSHVALKKRIDQIISLATENGMSGHSISELLRYQIFLEELSKIDIENIMVQMDLLENDIYSNLLPDNRSKTIRLLDLYIRLLKKAYGVQLSNREFKELESLNEILPMKSCVPYVNQQLSDLEGAKYAVPQNADMEMSYGLIKQFYDIVGERDYEFMNRALNVMNASNTKVAILITGGYHSQHLAELMNAARISYAVLTPRVDSETDHEQYERILFKGMNSGLTVVSDGDKEHADNPQLKSDHQNEAGMYRQLSAAHGLFPRLDEEYTRGRPAAGRIPLRAIKNFKNSYEAYEAEGERIEEEVKQKELSAARLSAIAVRIRRLEAKAAALIPNAVKAGSLKPLLADELLQHAIAENNQLRAEIRSMILKQSEASSARPERFDARDSKATSASRRRFLQLAAAGLAAAGYLSFAGVAQGQNGDENEKLFVMSAGEQKGVRKFLRTNRTAGGMPLSYKLLSQNYWKSIGHAAHQVGAIIERLITTYSVNIYDAATGQIAEMIMGDTDLADQHTKRLLSGRSGKKGAGLDSIRGAAGFTYNGKAVGNLPGQIRPENTLIFRTLSDQYAQPDPLDGKKTADEMPNGNPVLRHEDWKPIVGEQPWATDLGPLQVAHKTHQGNIPLQSDEVKLALSILPALEALQSPIGGIYHAPEGTADKDPREISNENQLSLVGGLRMLLEVLEKNKDASGVAEHIRIVKKILNGEAGQPGIMDYLKNHAFNPRMGVFDQGGFLIDGLFKHTEDLAVDVQTWGIMVLGPGLIDEWFGEGAAYKMWKQVKERAGYFDEKGTLRGVGFTDGHDITSAEWGFGAVMAGRSLARHYEKAQQKWSQEALQDSITLRNGIENDLRVTFPDGSVAYKYANKRYPIKFGWWANPIPSLAATSWAIMVDANFDPFILGGGNFKNLDFIDRSKSGARMADQKSSFEVSDEGIRYGQTVIVKVVALTELREKQNDYPEATHVMDQYYEYLRIPSENQAHTIYIANSEASNDVLIERLSVWQMRKKLNAHLFSKDGSNADLASSINLDATAREQIILKIVTEANILRLGPGATEEDVLRAFFINSQKRFETTTQEFIDHPENYQLDDYDVGDENYDHVRHFSWIYAEQIREIKRLLDRHKDKKKLVIMDVGTGFGHFILTAAKLLSPEEMSRLKFIGMDYKLKDMRFAVKEIEKGDEYPNLEVEWHEGNVNDPNASINMMNMNGGAPVDLTVINHVLEHLDTKTIQEYVSDWARATRGTVSVTVPLEDSLGDTVSSHTEEFSVERLLSLGADLESATVNGVEFDGNSTRGGMMIFRWKDEAADLKRSVQLFGWSAVRDIHRVYSTVWGRDSYRLKGQSMQGSVVSVAEILGALNAIASEDAIGAEIAKELADSLRYSQGTVDSGNLMKPISPQMIRDIAKTWRINKSLASDQVKPHADSDSNLSIFEATWSEWNTYLDYRARAEAITGRSDVDSFETIDQKKLALLTQGKTPKEREAIGRGLARNAHEEYEKADLLSLKVGHVLMRTRAEDIERQMQGSDWEAILKNAVLAVLHGEGKYYQSLRVLIHHHLGEDLAFEFWRVVDDTVTALESGYRQGRPLDEIKYNDLGKATHVLIEKLRSVDASNQIDFDAAYLKYRQLKMREAENHLEAVEDKYARSDVSVEGETQDAADAYKDAMLDFADGLNAVRDGAGDPQVLLEQFRVQLIRARKIADRDYPHDFAYWTGARELVGQNKSRAQHPRYRLYQMEAYAERMYLAGQLAVRDWAGSSSAHNDLGSIYEDYFNFDERSLYTQEWVANYGPRRAVMFGHAAIESIPENEFITRIDQWIADARRRLVNLGADPDLWGPASTGYTEPLRYLLTEAGEGLEQVIAALEALIAKKDIEGFTAAVKNVNPYDANGLVDSANPPFATTGVHIHNVDPVVSFETFVHMREVFWPEKASWRIIGTTTSNRKLAEKEHEMALELGLTRFGISNRQLLKAGQQNRIIPNTPRSEKSESFYLTLDDDYVPSPLSLQHMVPLLVDNDQSAFVQAPLFFRAAVEPGHSIGRRLDAIQMGAYTADTLGAFNELDLGQSQSSEIFKARKGKGRASVSLPTGTVTLYRTTTGRNALEGVGGFVADPTTVMSGEDYASGTYFELMRAKPELFEEVKGVWQGGIFLSKAIAVGDGVDLYPGAVKQKTRWTLSGMQIGLSIWLKNLLSGGGMGDLHWKSAMMYTNIFTGFGMLALIGTFSLIAMPIIAFTSLAVHFASPWLLILVTIQWLVAPSLIGLKLQKLTPGELAGMAVMSFFGMYFSYLTGAFKAITSKPGEDQIWHAAKNRQKSNKTRAVNIGMGLLHLSAAVAGLIHGAPIFALNFVSAAGFFSLVRFEESAANGQIEKINMIARDVKDTWWKHLNRKIAYGNQVLGKDQDFKHARKLWNVWAAAVVLGAAALLVGGIGALFAFPIYLAPFILLHLVAGIGFALSYTISTWSIVRSIENRSRLKEHIPTATPEALVKKIASSVSGARLAGGQDAGEESIALNHKVDVGQPNGDSKDGSITSAILIPAAQSELSVMGLQGDSSLAAERSVENMHLGQSGSMSPLDVLGKMNSKAARVHVLLDKVNINSTQPVILGVTFNVGDRIPASDQLGRDAIDEYLNYRIKELREQAERDGGVYYLLDQEHSDPKLVERVLKLARGMLMLEVPVELQHIRRGYLGDSIRRSSKAGTQLYEERFDLQSIPNIGPAIHLAVQIARLDDLNNIPDQILEAWAILSDIEESRVPREIAVGIIKGEINDPQTILKYSIKTFKVGMNLREMIQLFRVGSRMAAISA